MEPPRSILHRYFCFKHLRTQGPLNSKTPKATGKAQKAGKAARKATGKNRLDVKHVEQTVDEIIADPLYWFPVRHHSPATAFHLKAAILERKPKIILIEGPSESNSLIPILQNSKSKPPIAIYSCFEDVKNRLGLAGIESASEEIPPRWACWFPFMEYSPELVAIETAKKIGAKVRFIDLPHFARIEKEKAAQQDQPEEKPDTTKPIQERNYEAEKMIVASDFYQSLASAGGYKNWDEAWDAMFEFRKFESAEEFRRELLAFCAASRATSTPADEDFEENLDRERFMMQSIRKELKTNKLKEKDAMVVCGGYHTSLNRNDETPAPEIPKGKVYTTVVPYTYFQVSDLSGYGAGNRAPRFYQLHWKSLNGKVNNPRAEYIVSVLQAARKMGESLSAADSISISQHTRMLSAIRGRSEPVLDDLHDAIITCCCKGDPAEQGLSLKKAMDQVDIGNLIGKVPSSAPRLPLVDDFYQEIERLDLAESIEREEVKKYEIDKREEAEFAQSAFFHRLEFINIKFAKLERAAKTDFDSGLIFRERWALKWSPTVEAKLIERNLLGDSIETAATNQLRQHLVDDAGNAGNICMNLVAAMQMDLPNIVDQVFDQALAAIEEDTRFLSLAESVNQLQILDRHAIHHEMRREKIQAMFRRGFLRSCFAMPDIVSAPDEQHGQIIQALLGLADVVLKSDKNDSNRTVFADAVKAAYQETQIPFLRGAMLGVLVEIKLESQQKVVDEIQSFSHSPQEIMVNAGDFIHGTISVSRASLMSGAAELVHAIDDLIKKAKWEIFVIMLPRLRAAMELLHARHRDSLASRVAEKYGLAEAQTLKELDVSVGVATEIAELDKQVAEIMAEWTFDG